MLLRDYCIFICLITTGCYYRIMRIKTNFTACFFASFILLLAGCALLPMPDGQCLTLKTVRPISDVSKTVTVYDGMVFCNFTQTQGVRFPGGTYILEAEDDDYWYFHSFEPIEIRETGRQVLRYASGGLMLAKRFSMVPGGAYIDGDDPEKKTMVRMLGGEFSRVEGRSWRKSF